MRGQRRRLQVQALVYELFPQKLFWRYLSNGSLFFETSALRPTSILPQTDVLSKHNKMADSLEISFVDKK